MSEEQPRDSQSTPQADEDTPEALKADISMLYQMNTDLTNENMQLRRRINAGLWVCGVLGLVIMLLFFVYFCILLFGMAFHD